MAGTNRQDPGHDGLKRTFKPHDSHAIQHGRGCLIRDRDIDATGALAVVVKQTRPHDRTDAAHTPSGYSICRIV